MAFVWKNAGPIEAIPRRGARRLWLGQGAPPVALFRTAANAVFALIDRCPHRGGPLSEGIVAGETVTCPLHNWVIGLADGCAVAPDEGRTRVLPVRIVGGEVHVGVPVADEAAA